MYERSYMHRDIITQTVCTRSSSLPSRLVRAVCATCCTMYCRTDFLVTASVDGHVKFWKKQEQGVEFVKHFRAHLGVDVGLSLTAGALMVSRVQVGSQPLQQLMMDCYCAQQQKTRLWRCLMCSTLVGYLIHDWLTASCTFLTLDMINMLRLSYIPSACVWLYAGGATTAALAWSAIASHWF